MKSHGSNRRRQRPRIAIAATALLALWAGLAPAQAPEAVEDTVMTPSQIMSSDLDFDAKVSALNHLLTLNPRDADLYNNLGILYAEQEDWPSARDAFLAAVQSSPTTPTHHKNLGLVFVELEQYSLADNEFRAYQRFTPGGAPDGWLLIGDAWRRAGDTAQALVAYEEGLGVLGDVYGDLTAQLLVRKVQIVDESGDEAALRALLKQHQEAARDHRAASGNPPSSNGGRASHTILQRLTVLYIDDARLLADAGRHADAAASYEAALDCDPNRQDLFPHIALAWLEAGEAMKAKVMVQRAVTEAPDSPAGWRAKGMVAEREKRSRDALAAYERAYELAPENDLAARIGQIYLTLGENAKARRFMGAVVADPETSPGVIFNYALSLQREDQHGLAVPPLRRVTSRAPDMVSAWRALGVSLRSIGEYGEAAEAFGRAFELDPDAKIAFQVGYSAGRAGRSEASVVAYRQAVDLDPTYEKAWYNLATAEIKAGDYETAVADLGVLEAMEGSTYRIHFSKGICYDGIGDDEAAITSYEAAIEVKETSAAWNNLGLALKRLGEEREANECFEIAEELRGEGK